MILPQAALAIAYASSAPWLYLLALHGRFWRSGPVLGSGRPSGGAKVAAIVPARDEAGTIAQSLASLLAQDYAGPLAIVLVDDNSSDGTGAIAARMADERLTLVAGRPLPPGWSGKLWAVHQGLASGQARSADYLLLTDADIAHAADHVSRLVAKAEADQLDLVSEMVRLNCHTPAERALVPAFVFFFQMIYPFAWVNSPRRATAGAAGGAMLVRQTALERIGGIHRIRHELIDDCALAREIKRSAGRIWLGHSETACSLRVYGGFAEIASMIARTAYVQLGRSPLMLLGCVAGMALVYLAPPLLAAGAHGAARWLGAAAWLGMGAAFQPTLRRYRQSPLWGLALPAIALFYLGATVLSALRHFAGQGGRWKSRVYPGRPPA